MGIVMWWCSSFIYLILKHSISRMRLNQLNQQRSPEPPALHSHSLAAPVHTVFLQKLRFPTTFQRLGHRAALQLPKLSLDVERSSSDLGICPGCDPCRHLQCMRRAKNWTQLYLLIYFYYRGLAGFSDNHDNYGCLESWVVEVIFQVFLKDNGPFNAPPSDIVTS